MCTLKKRTKKLLSTLIFWKKPKNAEVNDHINKSQTFEQKEKYSTLDSTATTSSREADGIKYKGFREKKNHIKKEDWKDLFEEGNAHFHQGDYQKAANFYTEALLLNPKNETNFHNVMSSIYTELAAIDLGRHSCESPLQKKIKQLIWEEKKRSQMNLFKNKFVTFLSTLSIEELKSIALQFSLCAYDCQKRFAEFKGIETLKKNCAYIIVRFERIKTPFGIAITAHLIDRSGAYSVVFLPKCYIQSLNHFVINSYNKCLSGNKIKLFYRGTDMYGPRMVFRV
ncbi:uncharacterized protein isoform X2 [Rhodnius prolixus]|uniref:uncharacterized protein isoform X2 n=1 Tax=Rhodnius prolixus TaxID=13249 RepID=UPI003D187B43